MAAASRLRVGPGTDPSSDLGPVISAAAKKRVLALIESALAEGATLLLDGRSVEVRGQGRREDGYVPLWAVSWHAEQSASSPGRW